jgi:aryl-alcohol dehydrogenase-like predicted oxidoreductase
VERIRLGRAGPQVARLGFGAMVLSNGIYGSVDRAEAEATLRHAVDAGITLVDTADIYANGDNERLVGRVLRDRTDAVIATKVGFVPPASGRQAERRADPSHIRHSAEASLRRLGRDAIDIYFLHRVDPETPLEESIGTMAELVCEGRVRALGVCEVTPDELRRAHAVHPIAALQSEYSLFHRLDPEVIATARELGVGIVPFSPLGRGLLVGAARRPSELADDDFRRSLPRFEEGNLQHNVRLADALADIAAQRSITPAQLALAWLFHQGHDLVPIPGTRRRSRVDENLGALEISLDSALLTQIEEVVAPGVAGAQYPSG